MTTPELRRLLRLLLRQPSAGNQLAEKQQALHSELRASAEAAVTAAEADGGLRPALLTAAASAAASAEAFSPEVRVLRPGFGLL